MQTGPYKVDPHIEAAVALQSLDHATALARLHAMARSKPSKVRVIVLCRMLFTPRPGSEFRRPGIGARSWVGGTNFSDWPLEPIELVAGVPFLVAVVFMIAGVSESDDSYLHYCETHCDWSAFRYSSKTEQQKTNALRALISSAKWKTPLEPYELKFLEAQIK